MGGGVTTVGGRVLSQGALASGANATMQKAAGREDIDGREALVAGAFGAGGEAASLALRGVVPLFERMGARATRQQKAAELAKLVDGAAPTNARVQQLMSAVDEIDAGADPAAVLGREEFGFQYSLGQTMKASDPRRPGQLTQEEFLRTQTGNGQNVGGPARPFFEMDNANRGRLESVTRDRLRGWGGGENSAVGEVSRLQTGLVSARTQAK
jgi:hypothetical protein